ncbi:hypothetical protein [Streptomyces sp. NPDC056240]|uniref:hypothetical protein n=1 Tax=Streptomyces sp. NPDC056240 TaxID=3345759 RepID=UPI0035DB6F66
MIRHADNARCKPPGGVLERDEAIGDGVCREVFEETRDQGARRTTDRGLQEHDARGRRPGLPTQPRRRTIRRAASDDLHSREHSGPGM